MKPTQKTATITVMPATSKIIGKGSSLKLVEGVYSMTTAESAFSCLKRVLGEYICAVRWPNIVKELLLKGSIYNLFMKMNLG